MSDLPANTSFSRDLPGLQLYWDSTSLGALKKCPRYYEYTMVNGYVSKGDGKVDLLFGIWLHSARERYYHSRAGGSSHDEAIDAGLVYLLSATWLDGRPWASNDANKNRYTLIRSFVWYCDQYEDDPMEQIVLANGKPAVELSFRFALDLHASDGSPFYLAGHLDRLATFQSQAYISDLKSTKKTLNSWYFDAFTPDNQMSLYSLAAKVVYSTPVVGLIIDAVQVMVEGTRFHRAPVLRTNDQLDEWLRGTEVLLEQAEAYAQSSFWPQNDRACFNCEFRSVCSKPPRARELFLKEGFTQRVWDPLVARGDV